MSKQLDVALMSYDASSDESVIELTLVDFDADQDVNNSKPVAMLTGVFQTEPVRFIGTAEVHPDFAERYSDIETLKQKVAEVIFKEMLEDDETPADIFEHTSAIGLLYLTDF